MEGSTHKTIAKGSNVSRDRTVFSARVHVLLVQRPKQPAPRPTVDRARPNDLKPERLVSLVSWVDSDSLGDIML